MILCVCPNPSIDTYLLVKSNNPRGKQPGNKTKMNILEARECMWALR